MKARFHGVRIVSIGLVALCITALLFSVQPAVPTRAADQIDLVGPPGSASFGANVTVLPNGNIVVADPYYGDYTGAVYLYNGASGALISTLTGSTPDDKVGSQPVQVLSDGNFVVSSPEWANGATAQAGAVTWCSAVLGCAGPVSPANSLVGSHAGDQVGYPWYMNPGIFVLDQGAYVVRSNHWTNGTAAGAGAVTWCPAGGCSGAVSPANSLVGSTAGDEVGRNVIPLSDNSYVVNSITWSNGGTSMVGAVTWCDDQGSCNGQAVSTANSLVGSQEFDWVGGGGVIALSNGSYAVGSPDWDNATVSDAGAVTWCDGSGGCNGQVVTTANSLVGSSASDQISYFKGETGYPSKGLVVLDNGNYVVRSSYWDNGATADAGALTWCSGSGSCNGQVISATNSLVGTNSDEQVGLDEIVPLENDNFLVLDRFFLSISWCNGTVGCHGEIPTTDTLVDISSWAVLPNGNYVVVVDHYTLNNDYTKQYSLARWCDGTVGCSEPWSGENSLTVEFTSLDSSMIDVFPLEDSSYVIRSTSWDLPGAENVGLVTWCGANGACNGQAATSANSLVGSSLNDGIGSGQVLALKGGGYAVASPLWDNGADQDVGAVTLCDDQGGCNGKTVTAANSLVGSTTGDRIGFDGASLDSVQALQNGGYVVPSPQWHSAGVSAGAVTLCSATGSCTGQVVSAANSLAGSADQDLSQCFLTELADGNQVISCPGWDNGPAQDAGAVTWCSAADGCHGVISPATSLVGDHAGDQVGRQYGIGNGAVALPDGSYVVVNSYRDNGTIDGAGEVIWCKNLNGGCNGDLCASLSALGQTANGGTGLHFAYDPHNQQVVVGLPSDNKVTLLKTGSSYQTFIPHISR